jgi:hypothetical protein
MIAAAIRHGIGRTLGRTPNLLELGEELVVVGDVAELAGPIGECLERAVRRARADEMHACVVYERQVARVGFTD